MMCFGQKYNFTQEITSTNEKVQQVEKIVEQEFGSPSSPGIWTSKSSDYGLMIRTKSNTFYIRAWEINPNSDIKARVDKLMADIKPIL